MPKARRGAGRIPLQIAVTIASLVPISAGLAGAIFGASFLGWLDDATFDGRALDSHVRYLSALLVGIGVAFLATVPDIERHRSSFALLTAIVFAGGLARLAGLAASGIPHRGMLFGLVMELVVTPLLWAWQRRIAAKCEQAAD
jgi:hypothetical protein